MQHLLLSILMKVKTLIESKTIQLWGMIVLSTKQNAILLLKEVLSKFRYTAWVLHILHAGFLTEVIYLYQIISMMEII